MNNRHFTVIKVDIQTLQTCSFNNTPQFKCKYAKWCFKLHEYKCIWRHLCPHQGEDKIIEDTILVNKQKGKS